MKKTEQQKAIEELQKANEYLLDALIRIQNCNKSSQFDYTTSSTLSNTLDGCLHIAEKINKIVYQK